jgi:hypothetical protein
LQDNLKQEIAENAKLTGHKNHAQRINYVERLKEQPISTEKVRTGLQPVADAGLIPDLSRFRPVDCCRDTFGEASLYRSASSPPVLSTFSMRKRRNICFDCADPGNGVGTSDDVLPLVPVARSEQVSSTGSLSYGAANVARVASPTTSVPLSPPGGRWHVPLYCGSSVLSTPRWSSRRDSAATVYLTCQSQLPEFN